MCIEAGTLGQGCKMRAGGGEEMRWGCDDGEAGARRITRLAFSVYSALAGVCAFVMLRHKSLSFPHIRACCSDELSIKFPCSVLHIRP